jgi:hypothetical protein
MEEDATKDFGFGISGFDGLKSRKLDNRNHEITKPEVPIWKGAIIY